MKFHKRTIVGLILILVISIVTTYYFYPKSSRDSSDIRQEATSTIIKQVTEIEQVPFKELTIPYLRSRSYESKLSELNKYSTNSEYTSYLTSYDSDGLNINGLLTIPTQSPPQDGFPAVVFVHGYIPPAQYSTTDNYESYVDYLARQGLVIFKIDLRGHGASEGTASGAYFSGDYIIDVLNAYVALENADFVDSSRIGLWGHSMAGNVVLRSAVAQQTIPKAVIWAGAVYTYEDFYDLRISDSSYQRPSQDSQRQRDRDALFETHGEFSTDSEFWQMVTATNYLDDVNTRFQIHHAENDSVVAIEYSDGLSQVFDEANIPHDYFRYSQGGHNISGSVFSIAMQRTADFFLEN